MVGKPASGGSGTALAVTAACLLAAAAVYANWLRPALAEHRSVAAKEAQQLEMRARLMALLDATRQRQAALTWDLQTVLVAIDDAGSTPFELLGTDDREGSPNR